MSIPQTNKQGTHLHAGADEHAEEHGPFGGRAEHVSVHQLPAALLSLLRLLLVRGQLQIRVMELANMGECVILVNACMVISWGHSLLTLLYLEMSMLSALMRIMATMKARNSTIRMEFTMLNQCTLSGTAPFIDK